MSTSGYGAGLYMDVDRHYNSLANNVPNGATLVLSYQATTRSTVIESRTHGENSMGLTPEPQMCRRCSEYCLLFVHRLTRSHHKGFAILLQWSDITQTRPCDETIRTFTSTINASAAKENRQLTFVYQNDAGYFQSPLESLMSGTYEKLITASLKYDPGRVFQHSQRGGFLLEA